MYQSPSFFLRCGWLRIYTYCDIWKLLSNWNRTFKRIFNDIFINCSVNPRLHPHSFGFQLTNTDWLICLGDRLEVDTNATRFNQTAVLVSPLYNRSRDGHSKCLKFRYMLRGPGEKTLTIYQKVDNHRETPVWVSERETDVNWIYGQVPLSSISKFQVTMILRPTISPSVNFSSVYPPIPGPTFRHRRFSQKMVNSHNRAK